MLLASNLLQTKALQKNQQSPLNRKTKTRHTGSFISPRLGKHATCKDTNGIFLKVLFHILFFFLYEGVEKYISNEAFSRKV